MGGARATCGHVVAKGRVGGVPELAFALDRQARPISRKHSVARPNAKNASRADSGESRIAAVVIARRRPWYRDALVAERAAPARRELAEQARLAMLRSQPMEAFIYARAAAAHGGSSPLVDEIEGRRIR